MTTSMPLPGAFGQPGDPQHVHAGVGAERARRAMRPDQHDRLRRAEGQVQEKTPSPSGSRLVLASGPRRNPSAPMPACSAETCCFQP